MYQNLFKAAIPFLIAVISVLPSGLTYAQGTLTGIVTDAETGEVLPGANVLIQGTHKGASTDVDGRFNFTNLQIGTYTIEVLFIGYEKSVTEVTIRNNQETEVTIALTSTNIFSEPVVISGTRRPEKITESPATIQVITAELIENTPTFNPGELLSRLKGVEYVRSGIVGTGINVRGFNSNFNSKNLQVADGRLATLVATGLPFGPLNTQIKEDIERVEVILGPNSALYGPNAHSGLVNIISKDPRSSEGTTIAIGAGNQSVFSARARHAQVLNDKLAFKVTGEFSRGEEFEYVDSVYIDRDGTPGKEGYPELELDRDFKFMRAEAGLYYSLTDDTDLILNYGHSNSTYLAPTNVGRNQIIDWKINYFQLKYVSPKIFAQVYRTHSGTEDTYSIDDRTKAYYAFLDAGFSDAEARGEMSYSTGARFIDDSQRWNAEVQYNDSWGAFELVTGLQWQRDMANSHSSYLLDEDEDDFITLNQIGAYVQGDYIIGDGYRATGAIRADNHDVYDFHLLPKFGILKDFENGTARFTYGMGIATPTILNMYGDLFSGLILGNAEGFTLTDGSKIEKQSVEKLQTFEIGYKGMVNDRLYVDANTYYNMSENFLSPVTIIGVASERGNTPIQEVQSGYSTWGGLVLTYVNFGKVNTYGFDLGITYAVNKNVSIDANYSFFDWSYDEDNLENDFNKDGKVDKFDVLVNSPHNKVGVGVKVFQDKFFGNVFGRWVEEYDYFSSFQIAAKTQDASYRGTPIVENARSTDSFNYGPLGGFVNVDLGLGYHVNEMFTVSGQVTNLFNNEVREFTASPFIERLVSVELKVNF